MTAVRPVIRLLGEPLLLGGDGERVAFRTTKVPALLAYLVARGGRPALRTEVAEALWPARDAGLAHQNLRQTLLYLRGCLGPEGEEAIQANRRDVRLRPGFAQCDVETFRAALSEGTDGLERAAALYGGPFMEGFDDDWLLPVRAELAHAYVRALLELSDAHRERNPERALDYAERAIAVEPFHDGARTRKIRALRCSGEEALALREFEAYETLLAEELGLRPARSVEEALSDREPARPESRTPEPPLAAPSATLGDALRVLSGGERPEDAVRLAVSLTPYWMEVGTPGEGLRRLDEARLQATRLDDALTLRVCVAAGELAMRIGDLDRASVEAWRAIELAEDDFGAVALCAKVNLRRRETEIARRLILSFLRHSRASGSELPEAWLLLGSTHDVDDRATKAEKAARRVQASTASPRLYARAGILLAISRSTLGFGDEARAILQDSVAAIAHDVSPEMAATRVTAARQFESVGDLDAAERGYVRAIEEFRRLGERWILPLSLTYLADLRVRRGEPERSIPLYEEALALRKATDNVLGAATCVCGQGVAYLRMGDLDRARNTLREAVRLFADWGPGVARCLVPLAQAEAAVGSRDVARRLALRAVRLLRGMTPETRFSICPEGERLLPDAESLLAELR